MYNVQINFRLVNPYTNETERISESGIVDGDPRYRDEEQLTHNFSERLALRFSDVMRVVFIDKIVDENGEIIFLREGNAALGGFSQGMDAGGLITISEGPYHFPIWRRLRPYAPDDKNAMNWLAGGRFWHPFESRHAVYHQAIEPKPQKFIVEKGSRRFVISPLTADSPSISFGSWFCAVQSKDGKVALNFAYGDSPFGALRKAYKKQRKTA